MAVKMTLDDIREAIQKKYVSCDIPFDDKILVLRNPLRLPDEDRDEMISMQDAFGGTDEKPVTNEDFKEAMRQIILIAAEDEAIALDFLEVAKAAGGDETLILSEVFTLYMSDQQVGEA